MRSRQRKTARGRFWTGKLQIIKGQTQLSLLLCCGKKGQERMSLLLWLGKKGQTELSLLLWLGKKGQA